ncbi:MAG: hypothetical protein ABW004_14800 [Aeromicrobium sp.]
MDSAWDQLLDLLDQLAADPQQPVDRGVEARLAALSAEAQRDGDVDGELHVADTARWLAGLATAHRTVRANHPEVDADTDLADLRRIVTRWLHPARPGFVGEADGVSPCRSGRSAPRPRRPARTRRRAPRPP